MEVAWKGKQTVMGCYEASCPVAETIDNSVSSDLKQPEGDRVREITPKVH